MFIQGIIALLTVICLHVDIDTCSCILVLIFILGHISPCWYPHLFTYPIFDIAVFLFSLVCVSPYWFYTWSCILILIFKLYCISLCWCSDLVMYSIAVIHICSCITIFISSLSHVSLCWWHLVVDPLLIFSLGFVSQCGCS